MAFALLERDRDDARALARALVDAADGVTNCAICRMLSEAERCPVCADPARDASLVCVVESPSDQAAIEQTGGFHGRYFVLGGRLSPIDGVGPEEVGIPELLTQVRDGAVREVILATNSTVEGQATAHYIADALRDDDVRVSRIAQGVPLGGELEYVDGGTLSHAFAGRTPVEDR